MKISRNLLTIGLILTFSLISQVFLLNQIEMNGLKEKEVSQHVPVSADTEMYSKYPEVDKTSFSPYSSPGFMDQVELSFRSQMNVNYTCNIIALPRPFNFPYVFTPNLLYLNQTRKICLFFVKGEIIPYFSDYNMTIMMMTSTDNGTTWTEYQNITSIITVGQYDPTYKGIIAVNLDSVIHLIYRFGQNDLYYMNSTDEGLSWTPAVLIQNSIPFKDDGDTRLSMAVDPTTKTMHVLCATAHTPGGSGTFYFNSTDHGTSWSVPIPVPGLGEFDYQDCDISFNQTGAAFISGFNFTGLDMSAFIAEMPTGLWGPITLRYIGVKNDRVISCVDQTQNDLIFVNKSNANYNDLTMYKCINLESSTFSLYSPLSEKCGALFYTRMISVDGAPFYVTLSSYSGMNTMIFEHITEPLQMINFSGLAQAGNDTSLFFNATRNGHQVPYEYFDFKFVSYNYTLGINHNYSVIVKRDDLSPNLNGILYNTYISPENVDDNLDSLAFNFSSSDDVDYSYKILADDSNPIIESIVSGSLTNKGLPEIIMDESGRVFCFYIVLEGGMGRLYCQVSENGGLAWSEAKALTLSGYANSQYSVFYDRAAIYVVTSYLPVCQWAILKTIDGGNTWTKIQTNDSISPSFITLTRDGVFYAIMTPGAPANDTIFRSTDGGRTWDDLYGFSNPLSGKYWMGVDDVNQRLYIMNRTQSTNGSDIFSYNLATNEMSSNVMWNDQGVQKGFEHDVRVYFANNITSNTSFHLEINTYDGVLFGHESWEASGNGTIWVRTDSYTATSLADYSIENYFYSSDSNTSLYVFIEQRQSVDTVIIEGYSRMVYRDSGRTTRNELEMIDYRGTNFNNEFLSPGKYQIELAIYDEAKNRNVTINSFFIDNSAPSIYNITWNQIPIDPLPLFDTNVTFNINDTEGHLNNVEFYYRQSDTSWNTATVSFLDGTSYLVEIPGSSTSTRVEFYIRATDLAGNIGINNNNQSYYGWDDPVIEFVVLTLSEDQSSYDEVPVRVVFTEGQEAIDSVKIVTDFGVNITMSFADNAYQGNIPKFFGKDQFSYQILYQDKWGRIGVCSPVSIHTRPMIKIATITVPARDLKVTTNDKLAFSIRFDENSQKYIQSVKVKYQINSGSWQETILTNASGLFTGEIGPFYDGENVHYYLVYTDISGNETMIKESETTFALIPAMPNVQLNFTDSLIIVLISAIVGIIIGLGYSTALRTQQRDPFMTYSDAYKISLNERKNMAKDDANLAAIYILNDPIMKYEPKTQSKRTLIGVFGIAFIAAIALYYEWFIKFYEMATVIAVIIFLIVVLLFNIVMERTCEAASRNKKDLGKATILGLFFLVFIFGALALIFWVGSNMKWFNYYVYEDRTNLGKFVVPTLWISVATTYFTSMLLVVFTTISSIKKLWIRVKEHAENGSPLFDVFLFREKEILSIKQQIIYKTLAFIALVAVAVISATNLSTYSNLGMLALIPFIITSVLCIIFLGKKRTKTQQAVSIQPIVKCPSCSAMVPGGIFCNVCGKGLVLDLAEKIRSMKCAKCNAPNDPQAKFCQICGDPLQSAENIQGTSQESK